MNEDKSKFVEYHVPCSSCGSSDARSINDDGSSYCFSCTTFFPNDTGINQQQQRGDMQTAEKITDLSYHQGSLSAIADRGINSETCKKYGVKVIYMVIILSQNISIHTMMRQVK